MVYRTAISSSLQYQTPKKYQKNHWLFAQFDISQVTNSNAVYTYGDHTVPRSNPYKLTFNHCHINTRKNVLVSVL